MRDEARRDWLKRLPGYVAPGRHIPHSYHKAGSALRTFVPNFDPAGLLAAGLTRTYTADAAGRRVTTWS